MRSELALACTLLLGCGAQQDMVKGVEGARDVIVVAEPCLVSLKKADDDACHGDAGCLSRVKARWTPIADSLDAFHALWCKVSPAAEGCK